MKCPDGCGEIVSVNLDRRSGPAWRLYKRRELWSLFPSVDKPAGCGSHFILSYGKIIWMDSDWSNTDWDSTRLEDVKRYLEGRGMTSYVEIAEHLDAIPWDTLRTCRTLVREGLAEEGREDFRGSFRLCKSEEDQ
jgi:hypothetical protein